MTASDNDITLFAKTNFRNREVPFGIRRDDRRRHMYVIGKTGMGKTTLIENMVIQDILNGHGVCFVDPHGDSVEKILQYIPANRINDVIYLNPADVDFPIAFNPLEAVDPKHKHLVASGLMGVFTKIWAGVWSPRMEYILQNTILALLDSPGNTMLGVARMYVDKTYRKKIVDNIKDPVVKSFWVDEFANYQDKFRTEAVAPIQNKVGQFLSNAIIRNIVGQTKSSIDLRQIMDEKKILLLNLSKGRIGEDSSALLGAMIITKLQLAAMSRVDIPEEERADFYLYVDEFQNFATESFANILSEARKYRLNLIVAHQYIGQLVQDRNTVVRDAIFGNVGTMITFRVGADDAEFLEKEFEPTYLLTDLVNLAKFSIYLKLMINGVSSNPFSAITLAPISEPTGNLEKVIAVSRERYANQREEVEEKISRWLGVEFHTEAAKRESESLNEEGVAEDLRFRNNPTQPTPVRSATAAGRPVLASKAIATPQRVVPARPTPSPQAPARPTQTPAPARPTLASATQSKPAPTPSPAAKPMAVAPSNITPKPAEASLPAKPAIQQPTAPVSITPINPPITEELAPPVPDFMLDPAKAEPKAPPIKEPARPQPAPAQKPPVHPEAKQIVPSKPVASPSAPPHKENLQERRHTDRRTSDRKQDHAQHGHGKAAAKPKPENPVWDTVSRIASEKLAERTNRANQALETLTKSLRESVVKHPPLMEKQPAPQPTPPPTNVPAPAPKVSTPQAPIVQNRKFDPNSVLPPKAFPVNPPQPVPAQRHEPAPQEQPQSIAPPPAKPSLAHLGDPELPEDHIHPDDESLSPHHNIQHVISRHGELKPGESIKFD